MTKVNSSHTDDRPCRLFFATLSVWVVLLIHSGLFVWARYQYESTEYQPWQDVAWCFAVSTVAVVSSFQVLNVIFSKPGRVRGIANIALLLLVSLLIVVHATLQHPLDFFLIGDNFGNLVFTESWALIAKSASDIQLLVALNLVLVLLLLQLATGLFSKWPSTSHPKASLLIHSIVLVLILSTSLYRHNELTYLVRTAMDYSLGRYTHPGLPTSEKYPYVHKVKDSIRAKSVGRRPNIFLVLMESFNANFAETKTPEGREYTPIFNSYVKQGIYVERFYGNSIQSARALAPVFCSVPPSYLGKESVAYPDLRLRSIAHILRENGYVTLFYQGFPSLEFDGFNDFIKRLGFDAAYGMDSRFVGPEDQRYVWGFGLQDDQLYVKVFSHLDQQRAAATHRGETDQPPLFVTLFTTSNHYAFESIPPEQQYLYPSSRDHKKRFANSIHLADRYLARFFQELNRREYLNDSLVVICGDHSFPAGEHGNYYNESGFYEENFRVPLLLWWPQRLKPKRIAQSTHSQLDIAPTILDLLDIESSHHFWGNSILAASNSLVHPIPLIQPYNGTYLCVVKYPYKYIEAIRVSERYLFRLDMDPMEKTNIVEEFDGTELLKELQHEVTRIRLNQFLIERNRIWPPSSL